MGNNMGGGRGSSKAAKVMKINGELFKLKTPAKVFDVIKDYPDHILLDSDDFLRFNLRAKPLDPLEQLKPKRIYLLVQLPKFPRPLRRVRSGALEPTMQVVKITRRSVSDLSIMTGSDDGGSSGRTRVKIRLPKAVMERVVEESRDEDEVVERILRLCLENSAGDVVDGSGGGGGEERESGDEEEEGVIDRSCFNVSALCSPRHVRLSTT